MSPPPPPTRAARALGLGIDVDDGFGGDFLDAACAVVVVPLSAEGQLLQRGSVADGCLLADQATECVVGVVDEPVTHARLHDLGTHDAGLIAMWCSNHFVSDNR